MLEKCSNNNTGIQQTIRWGGWLAFSFILCLSTNFSYSSTPVGPMPEGNINLTINSTSKVMESYYITKGQYVAYPDVIVPMRVMESQPWKQAQFRIILSQNVKIRFMSDSGGGPTF